MEFSNKNPKPNRFRLPSLSPPPFKKQKTLSTTTTTTITKSTTKISTHTHTSSRQWNFSNHNNQSNLKDEIIIVSYNILGVTNAENHPYLYNRISQKYLNWERRKWCIRRELNCYNASILCLQEVDRFDDLVDILKPDGYKGIYKARTGDTHDGCAIFWRKDIFKLLHRESIEFRDYDLRDNVAQFCILKMRSTMTNSEHSNKDAESQISEPQTVVIGNIHALFNPKRGDIKLGQIRLFVRKAQKLSKEWGNIPVVIAGDLNSTPQSGIYDFLASSELDLLRHKCRDLSGQIEAPSRWSPAPSRWSPAPSRWRPSPSRWSPAPSRWRPFRSDSEVSYRWSEEQLQLAGGSEGKTHLRHHLELRSAYVGVPGSSSTRDKTGEPLATTCHSSFTGTVDYIWHSKGLVPVGVLETLPADALRKMGGLPSEEWGSDHFALVCKLAFADVQPEDADDTE